MPNKHVRYGAIFSLLAWAFFPQIGFIGFLLIFLSSVFIDIDHYFASVIAGNGWNPRKAYLWYIGENKTKKESVLKWIIPFHSIEFFIVAFGIWYLSSGWLANIILFMLIGSLFHMFLDLLELNKYNDPLYLKLSFFYTSYVHYMYLKHNGKKPKHLNSSESSY